jgi:hypothetical protein
VPIQGLCHTQHALKEAEEAAATPRADLVLESVRGFRKACRKKKEVRKKKKKQEKREIRTQRSRFPQSLQGGGKKREIKKKSRVLSSIETLI